MSDPADAPPGGDVISYPVDSTEPMSVEDAARDLASAREKAMNPTAESADPATAETELADEANAAPDEGTTVEDQGDEPELPAIDPPRSWSKDAHERWSKLDRDTQEWLATRDSEDQKAIKRGLNEAAELRKAADAERAQFEQKRKEYEAKLPLLEKKIQTVGPFADIQTMEDVRKLQQEDPFRFQAYQVHIWEEQAHQAELRDAEARKSAEQKAEWSKFTTEQSKLLTEYVPEADVKTYSPKAGEYLLGLGFKDEDLAAMANGEKFSPFDHRFQRLIYQAMKYDELKAAPPKAIQKPLPPVQRPGASKPAGAGVAAQIQALEKQLSSASGDKAARISADIYRLEKRAASR